MRKCKVLVESNQHPRQALPLIANLPVHVFLEPRMSAVEELAAAALTRNAHDAEFSFAVHSAHVFEAEEFECLRLLAFLCQPFLREATED